MQMRPNTSMAAVPGTDFSGLANLMAMKGRGGDNTLVHMSKAELPYLNMLAKSAGYPQGLPVNPETGLPEANILKTILPVAGAILGGMFLPGAFASLGLSALGSGALATGVGAGLGSFGGSLLAGKSLKDAAIGGLISGGLSGLGAATFGGQSFMGDTTSFTDPAAAEIAKSNAAAIAGKQGAAGFGDVGGGAGFGGVDTSYPLSDLSFAPGTSPLYTNPNIQVLGADGASLQALPTPYFRGIPSELGYSGVDPNVAGNMLSPSAQEYIATNVGPAFTPPAGDTPFAAVNALGDVGGFSSTAKTADIIAAATGQPTTAIPTAVTNADYVKALQAKDLVGKDFGVGDLREGFQATQSSLDAVQGMSKPSFLSFPKSYDPKLGLDRFDFLKTQLKPAATMGAVGIGVDAATGQGAFEPIDYSSFPQAGEERRVSPFDTSGIRFATRRTGAFPRTEEEALAFAQPGGNRQRFFDQRFFTSAKTGGGLAALQVGGRPKTALDAAMAPDDEEGGLGTGATSSASGGLSNQTTGGLIGSGLGALGKAALGIGMFSLPGLAFSLGSNLIGQTIGAQQDQAEADAATAAAVASIAEDEMSIEDEDTTSGTQAAADAVAAAQAAAASQAAAAQALAEMDDFSDTSGDGGIGGGVDSSGAGPGSGFGDSGFGGPGGEEDSDSDGGSSGGGGAGPGGDGSEGSQGDDLKTGGLISEVTEMAKGGDILSFFSPAFGLGRAAKKGGIEGALSFLSPAFALSQGQLPGPFNNLMSAQSGKVEQQTPAVRDAEAPTEQIAPLPTKEELEEARDVAVLQQVLSGVPVEAQAGGLISAYQMGGPPSPYFEGMVKGRGDGMSDSIPFTIEGTQPAILSRDEYVLPADIVAMMGNGSSDAGAEKIDSFINDFRVQKYGRGKQPPETRRGLSSVA